MKTDTPRTNRFYASFADGECIPNQDEWLALCQSLESQLTAVTEQRDEALSELITAREDYRQSLLARAFETEQRDRLAEALKSIASGAVYEDKCILIAREALQSLDLAAVKGGDQ